MPEGFLIQAALTACASFGGALVQRVSGFGYGIFVMIFYTMFLPHGQSTALSALVSMGLSASVAWRMRKHIHFKQVLIPMITYTVTSTIALNILGSMDVELIKRVMGAFLILLSIYFFFFHSKIHIKPTPANALIAGALGGVCGGFFSMGGPPMVIYYLNSLDSTDDYLATIQCYFALSNVISNIGRAAQGFITETVLLLLIPAAAAMLLGKALGGRIYGKISPDLLKKIVYAFMAVSGAISLLK